MNLEFVLPYSIYASVKLPYFGNVPASTSVYSHMTVLKSSKLPRVQGEARIRGVCNNLLLNLTLSPKLSVFLR